MLRFHCCKYSFCFRLVKASILVNVLESMLACRLEASSTYNVTGIFLYVATFILVKDLREVNGFITVVSWLLDNIKRLQLNTNTNIISFCFM